AVRRARRRRCQAARGLPPRLPRRRRDGGARDPRARSGPGPRRRRGGARRGASRPPAGRGRPHRGRRAAPLPGRRRDGMTPFLGLTWAVLRKDLAVERRAKEGLNALAFFALLLLFLFYFALGPDGERLRAALPGLFWLTFVLAGLLGLGRTFALERENACL